MFPAETVATVAAALDGPDWLKQQRSDAADRMAELELPTFELEEWRYSPIDELKLDRFAPAATEPAGVDAAAFEVSGAIATVVTVDGFVTSLDAGSHAGVEVFSARSGDTPAAALDATDVFGEANTAFAPDPIVVRVAGGTEVEGPIVITHHLSADGTASFPRLLVDVGPNAGAQIVEVFLSDDIDALTIPSTRIDVADASRVRYQQVQDLGPRVWQLGALVADVAGQAHFAGGVAAMGGGYGRLRTDCRLTGRGANGDLLAVYYGDGDQTLDFRTFQDHMARDTTSNLLFKGVLDDSSTSIYTGLIRVAPDAAGTNAFQTNRNIKLSEDAWAESVPNLEIENNDVRCSHASTVSPVDEEQRFYLESRGVPTPAAERLIVEGFLDEVVSSLPVPAVAEHVTARIQAKLDERAGR